MFLESFGLKTVFTFGISHVDFPMCFPIPVPSACSLRFGAQGLMLFGPQGVLAHMRDGSEPRQAGLHRFHLMEYTEYNTEYFS